MRGVCFIWGVGSRGLDLKFTSVGSLWVTRRERRKGVFSGWAEEPLLLLLLLLLSPLPGVVVNPALVDGAVSALPSENVELIDAPILLLFVCLFIFRCCCNI